MKVIVASPSIAPHVKESIIAYDEAGYLSCFYTSFIDQPNNRLLKFIKLFKYLRPILGRRVFNIITPEKIRTRPLPELLRSISARLFKTGITDAIWEWAELGFDRWVAQNITASCEVVHTYEHAALATLKKCRKLNLFSIYEQPSQYHEFFSGIAISQLQLYPELNSSASELLINQKARKRNSRRDEELKLASLILCNSTFTKQTLIAGGVLAEKIFIIPLAFPPISTADRPMPVDQPVRFLYAGNQSLRKGSHLLYEAWRLCKFKENEASLQLIGKMLLPETLRSHLPGHVTIRSNVPHEELMEFYQSADVFLLPTLADGFGMVVTEAMSQGVPVIASLNSCGPDIINHMVDGWLITPGDVSALVEQMKWCVQNRGQMASFSKAAREKASSWQWPQYRQKLTETILNEWQKSKKP
jgi:glycosyltransferase involved in cell wall biosynthesis